MQDKRCFVVMPIKTEGTAEHTHFRALYDEILKPALEGLGYRSMRSDEVQKTGAITKDIVIHLAESDLVVVDLTDLNPNVFYELGVRHSLRGQGTVMIVDELRTDNIPFDLGAYRVVKFKGDLPGFGKLRRELLAVAQQLNSDDPSRRDNPVHDCFPSLPFNALEASTRSTEGALRERLASAERRLVEYEERYGPTRIGADQQEESPLSVVMLALEEANEGNLPPDLMRQADDAKTRRDTKAFLSVIRRVLERRTARLAPRQFLDIADHALSLGLRDVTDAILVHARKVYPQNNELSTRLLASQGHSHDPVVRERARRDILKELGIVVSDDKIDIPARLDDDKEFLFGIMLDTYYENTSAARSEALRITEATAKQFPNKTLFARNHARALKTDGNTDQAMEWYQRAIWCPDVSDVSAIWFGNALHNEGRHVDAIEVYLLACLLDLDDANGFAQLADELTVAIKATGVPAMGSSDSRKLPDDVGVATFQQATIVALSCGRITQADIDRLERAAKRIQVARVEITGEQQMSFQGRRDFVLSLYEEFKSPLTVPQPSTLSAAGGKLA